MALSSSDRLLLIISLIGFSLIALSIYLLLPKNPPKPRTVPAENNDPAEGTRAARRHSNRRARRRRPEGNLDEGQAGDDNNDDDDDATENVANETGEEDNAAGGGAARAMTKKERMKAAKKAEREERRRYEEQRREELRERKDAEEREYLERKEMEREELEREKEEAKRLEREKKEKEEQEYMEWKAMFTTDDSGEDAGSEEARINEFVEYLCQNKIVALEDLALTFGMNVKAVKDLLERLENEGRITGVMDDHGTYICVNEEQMKAMVHFIEEEGRVTLTQLAREVHRIIYLHDGKSNINQYGMTGTRNEHL